MWFNSDIVDLEVFETLYEEYERVKEEENND